MHICENNTNQFSAKIISKVQSRRSQQVLSISPLSASWISFSNFSCPMKIPAVWRELPPKSTFRVNYPMSNISEGKDAAVLVPSKNLILSIFRAKSGDCYILQGFELGFRLQDNNKVGVKNSVLKSLCDTNQLCASTWISAWILHYSHQTAFEFMAYFVNISFLIWIFSVGIRSEKKPSGSNKTSEKAVSTAKVAWTTTINSKFWTFLACFLNFFSK